MSTHWCETAWFTPMGLPNCSRLVAWSTAERERGSRETDRVRGVEDRQMGQRAGDERCSATPLPHQVGRADRDVGERDRVQWLG